MSVSQCVSVSVQLVKGRTRFAKLQSMRLDQGVLPGRCDQACEWLAKLACAHPRRLCCSGRMVLAPERLLGCCWVEGKLGSSALWGSHQRNGKE